MTKSEIIDDTIAYYGADPKDRRSIKPKNILKDNSMNEVTTCLYRGPGGRECAFQRVVENDLSFYDDELTRASVILADQNNPIKFKPEYAGHEKDHDFWGAIQSLHDSDENWDENGLSKAGMISVEFYKNIYCNSDNR